MYRILLAALVWILAVAPLAAQEKSRFFEISGDRFVAGMTAVHESEGADDLFMAGETVRNKQAIAGSAHLAGRKIVSTGTIGGDALIAGMDISLEGPVSGDVTLTGYNVEVGDVKGDLRASGANLVISGAVSGYALIAGDEVKMQSVIKGDVGLAARDVEFSGDARIEGKLTIYEEKEGKTEIPQSVISEDRIIRSKMAEWSGSGAKTQIVDWRQALIQFVKGVVIITIIAALVAAFIPQKLADLRRNILDRPFWNLFIGFLAVSAVVGATIVMMITVIGLLVAPATVLVAVVAAFAGYVVGSYSVGVALLLFIGRSEPDSFATRALAAGTGAFVVALIGLIPLLGWIAVLAIALVGAGSIAIWLFRPGFYVAA